MNDVFSRIVSLCPLLLRVSVIEQEEQLNCTSCLSYFFSASSILGVGSFLASVIIL